MPTNLMFIGTPVFFKFFLLLIALDCVILEAFRKLFLIVSAGKPICEKNSLISSERLSKVLSLLQIYIYISLFILRIGSETMTQSS